jgi:hypothetical protein
MARTRMPRTAMTLGENFEKLAKEMVTVHKAGSVSEYVRGLIVMDALIATGQAKGVHRPDVPSWLFATYPSEFLSTTRFNWKAEDTSRKEKEGLVLPERFADSDYGNYDDLNPKERAAVLKERLRKSKSSKK